MLSGCSHGYSDDLIAVEQVMESDPERALQMLDSMPANKWRSGDDRALYGLLDTELRIKNRLPVESDSLISEAIRHFWRNDDKKHLADGYIYKGRLEFNTSNYHDAMEDALSALDVSKALVDTLRLARSYELMADVYGLVYNHGEELDCRRKAAVFYKETPHQLNYYYCLLDIANDLCELGRYNESINLLDSLSFIGSSENPVLAAFYWYSYASPCYMLDDYVGAKSVLLNHESDYYPFGADEYDILVSTYLMENNPDSALYWMNIADSKAMLDGDSIAIFHSKFTLAKHFGDYREAMRISDKIKDYQEERISRILSANISDVKSEYYRQHHRLEIFKNKRLKAFSIVFAIFCSMLIIVIWLSYKMRLYKRSKELEEKILDIQYLVNLVNRKKTENANVMKKLQHNEELVLTREKEVEKLTKELHDKSDEISLFSILAENLFKKQFVTLNKLCDEYFEKRDSDKTKKLLYLDFEKVIGEMKSKKQLEELKTILNNSRNGLVDNLMKDLPNLKDEDARFLIYLFAGFSPRTVCLLTGYTKTNFYTKRNRWRVRLASLDSQNKDVYLKYLG